MRKELPDKVFNSSQQAQDWVSEVLMKVTDNSDNIIKLKKFPILKITINITSTQIYHLDKPKALINPMVVSTFGVFICK